MSGYYQKLISADPFFDSFAEEAYKSKDGYAIRESPFTGETEMFIAGTRNVSDFASNFLDLPLYELDRLANIGEKRVVDYMHNVSGIPTGTFDAPDINLFF